MIPYCTGTPMCACVCISVSRGHTPRPRSVIFWCRRKQVAAKANFLSAERRSPPLHCHCRVPWRPLQYPIRLSTAPITQRPLWKCQCAISVCVCVCVYRLACWLAYMQMHVQSDYVSRMNISNHISQSTYIWICLRPSNFSLSAISPLCLKPNTQHRVIWQSLTHTHTQLKGESERWFMGDAVLCPPSTQSSSIHNTVKPFKKKGK
jgi:hypothetical protein